MIPSDASEQGEHIAPVTYLFGARPGVEGTQPPLASEGHVSAAISPAHPVFRDESPVTAVTARERGSFERVSNVSMYALARRGMSSKEMRDYLLGREFDEEAVDEEIERLERVGLLDDDSLAETLVRTLRDRKGLGRSALTAELRRRHVDGDAIEEAMGGLDDDELERATAIAVKRAPQLRALDTVTAKRRLGAFLMRKGYSGSVVSTAVQRALEPAGPTFR
ncbi:hypothetical protein BH11ACT4_BH11ACT4_14240 [soil metagenome]